MSSYTIWDDRPASDWAEGFPLGNGRLGAMVAGRPMDERVSLNHDLLWRGSFTGPFSRTSRDREALLALCAEGRWDEADALLRQTLPMGRGIYINPFVPLGDLYLTMRPGKGDVTDYVRTLDLTRGVAVVEYTLDGARFRRESFCSHRYNLLVTRLTSSNPAWLCGEVSLSRQPDPECAVTGAARRGEIAIEGAFDEGRRFAAVTRLINRGGRTTVGRRTWKESAHEAPMAERHFDLGYVFDRDRGYDAMTGPSLFFDCCDEVILITAMATDHEYADPVEYARKQLDAAPVYEVLRADHEADFSALFDRARLILTDTERVSLRRMLEAEDYSSPAMIEVLYNASRYLAISSGRPQPRNRAPKAPINLQGLWNRDTWPAWDSDYHLDLNIQMCYWPLAQAGFEDFYEPFIAWMERLLPQARAAARDLYGADGAAYCGCCDPWTMGGGDTIGYGFLTAGAWLAQILWIAYEYSPSEALLRRIHALMTPIADFQLSMLREDAAGQLEYPFGSSPEMGTWTQSGDLRLFGPGSTCDLLLTRELFTHLAEAEERLGLQGGDAYRALAGRLRSPLRDGRVGEWVEDQAEHDPGHRHRSPFIAFCPGSSVTRESAPDVVKALETLLDYRHACGNETSAAFSYAWDQQILARLHRGDEALKLLQTLARIHLLPSGLLTTNDYAEKGGLGWFKGVKVYQIEASIGLLAAIGELFFQDQEGYAELLPACPKALPDGEMRGLRGRGGFVIDLGWHKGKPEWLKVTATRTGTFRLRAADGIRAYAMQAGEEKVIAVP